MSEEDGVTLYVSVDNTLCVKHRQCLQDRQTHCSNLLLVHPGEEKRHTREVTVKAFTNSVSPVLLALFYPGLLNNGRVHF